MKRLHKSIMTSKALQERVTPDGAVSHFLQTCRSLAAAGLAGLFLITGTLSGLSHEPGLVLMGNGTATIDGVFSAGEWAGAATTIFDANLPEGGTTKATLY